MPSQSGLVSIIIVTLNSEKWIEQCLNSVMTSDYKNIETIVVDNGSDDATVALTRKPEFEQLAIKLVENKANLGFAGGNNRGYEIAKGEFIFLLNADARVETDTITNVISTFNAESNVGIIQNKILLMDEPDKLDSAGSQFTKTGFLRHIGREEALINDKRYKIFSGKGASLFIKRDVLSGSFLFNESYGSYFEDTDLCWRAWLNGWSVIYSPIGITYHKGGGTAFQLSTAFTDFHSFKNRLQALVTNLQLRNLAVILPVHIILCLAIAAVYFLRGRGVNAIAIYKALWWNISHIKTVLQTRNKVQSRRKCSDKYIFALVAEPINLSYFWKSLINYTGW